uniref:SH3 domain-containing protein n=1 Tax=Mesocestoides corti TaxID=53468 RepID=A0A5K3G262_MESCO
QSEGDWFEIRGLIDKSQSGTTHQTSSILVLQDGYAPHLCPSPVGCLSFPHAIGSQRATGLAAARWSNMSAP